MKEIISKMHWMLSVQFGFDIRRMFRAFSGIPRYVRNWFQFRKMYNGRLNFLPCVHDWYEEGGSTTSEYFLQDLHVARQIHLTNPAKHVDVGSRIDGFVAHVASFREIEVFDIRPVTSLIPGIIFKRADLMNLSDSMNDYCDSLSCLHALEHFGLGRYGDPIDPSGYAAGLSNMAKALLPGGVYYLSVPVGQARVEFNAHRIFDPCELTRQAATNGLLLTRFAWIGTGGLLIQSLDPENDMAELSMLNYSLGIFTFRKQ